MRKLTKTRKLWMLLIAMFSIALISIASFIGNNAWANPGAGGGNNNCVGNCNVKVIKSAWQSFGNVEGHGNTERFTSGEAVWKHIGGLDQVSDYNAVNTAYNNAYIDCLNRNNQKCSNAFVAEIGYLYYQDPNEPPVISSAMSGPIFVNSSELAGGYWDLNGGKISQDTSLRGGRTVRQAAAALDNQYKVVIVILCDEDSPKGWYPTYEKSTFDAYTSTVRVDSHELDPCPYEYRMYAKGIDGYIKGWTLKPQVYKTAYGKLYDSIAKGEVRNDKNGDLNYNPGNAKNNGSFSGAYLDGSQNAKNAQLLAEYQRTCELAKNQVDNWDLENQKGVDNSRKNITGRDFTSNYAKGGIYKAIRERKDAQINYKTTEVEYYHASGTYYAFADWVECQKDSWHQDGRGNNVQCGHIGEDRPAAITGEFNKSMGDWTRTTYNAAKAAAEGYDKGHQYHGPKGFGNGQQIRPDRDIRIYDYGYRGIDYKFHSENNRVGSWAVEKNDRSGVTFKMKWTYSGAKTDFLYGFPGPNIDQQIRPVSQSMQSWKHVWHQDFLNVLCDIEDFEAYKRKLNAAGFDYDASISTVGNGTKYQAQMKSGLIDSNYAKSHWASEIGSVKNRLQSQWTAPGSKENDGFAAHGQYKYQDPDFYALAADMVAGNHEPFGRFTRVVGLKQVVPNDDKVRKMETKLNNVNKNYGSRYTCFMGDWDSGDVSDAAVVAGDTTAKAKTDIYGSGTYYFDSYGCTIENSWYDSAQYKASYDPVYTKECPFDCTDDSNASRYGYSGANGANKNVINGNPSSGASSAASGLKINDDDRSSGRYGIAIRPTDAKGHEGQQAIGNSTDMQFFRTNTWNYFKVDLWYPILNNGLSEAPDNASKTAKSTTIIRNDGTPWYINQKDPKQGLATAMQSVGTDIMSTTNKGDLFGFGNNPGTEYGGLNYDSGDPLQNVANQYSNGTGTMKFKNTMQLPGEHTAFRIKSMWPTDSEVGPLEFNIKWEYDVNNAVNVQTKFNASGWHDAGRTSIAGVSVHQAVSDGKCYGQQSTNPHGYRSTEKLFHDETGNGVENYLDRAYDGSLTRFGKFSIRFVRASAE